MRRMITSTVLALGAMAAAVMVSGCGGDEKPAGQGSGATPPANGTVTILWADWDPSSALQLLSEEYTKQSGVKITIDKKPWSSISDTKQAEFNNKGTTYDIFVGDSQWVGQGVTGGHYLELTGFIKENEAAFKDVSPAAMQFYSEYPKNSKKFYSVPCESDAMAIAYRKDLFEKHKEKFAAWAKGQGKADAKLEVPKMWDDLLLISRYFKEASGEPGMAGFIFPSTPGYDEAVMSYETTLWSYGGDWGDYEKGTVTIGSKGAVEALTMMKKLVDTSSETGKNAGYSDITTAFSQGKVAMAMTYMAFFPSFTSKKENRDYAAVTGFFNVPAGPAGRFTSLGGQGMSVNAHVDKDRQAKALAFLKWFSQEEIQAKWAKLGGYTANMKVMNSDDFKKATVYNELFPEAFGMMKDFWNNPEYDSLLSVARDKVSAVFQGKMTPEKAVEEMQKEQSEKLLKK